MGAASAIVKSRLLYTSSFLLSSRAMSTTALPSSKVIPIDVSSKVIPIDVVSDTVWPWCYIGKRRLDSALADAKARFPQLSFDVRWRPFEVCCAVCCLCLYVSHYLQSYNCHIEKLLDRQYYLWNVIRLMSFFYCWLCQYRMLPSAKSQSSRRKGLR